MYGDNGFVDVRYVFIQVVDDFGEFKWYGVVYGVWNVDGGGIGINCCFDYLCQIGNGCMFGIFVRKFNIIGVIMGVFYYIDSVFDYFVQCAVQFGGDVYW